MRSHKRRFSRSKTPQRRQQDKAVEQLIEAAAEAQELYSVDALEEHARRMRAARESRVDAQHCSSKDDKD